MSKEPTYRIGITLNDSLAQKFLKIKKFYGMQSNSDLGRLLISLKYNQIQEQDRIRSLYSATKERKN